MPDTNRVLAARGKSEARNQRRAVRRLNRHLARLVDDPVRTKYDWELKNFCSDRTLSWRDFHQGTVGFPWPVAQWAFTTIVVADREVLIGAAVVIPSPYGLGIINRIRFAVWHNVPETQVPFYDLKAAFTAADAYQPLGSKHDFRNYVLQQLA